MNCTATLNSHIFQRLAMFSHTSSPLLRQYILSIARRRLRFQQRWNSNATPSNTIVTPNAGTASAEAAANTTGKKQSRFSRIVSEMKKKPYALAVPLKCEERPLTDLFFTCSDIRGTHLTSFLILHEMTALAPLGMYFSRNRPFEVMLIVNTPPVPIYCQSRPILNNAFSS